ncbi:hypothetical protein VIGAN_03062700 [Vigna angularis var. angularis]|uniref:Uncharacterized protein n=1 Tax=Vigna angularis var. angularis TaxID=157739 RepID=A0A0S3RKE1_PHAAN|nr:hypothetical protein VIGAN_03062700 [Vigna angularis var. angularis]
MRNWEEGENGRHGELSVGGEYVLTAFKLLHKLLDDGRDDQAIRLKQYFSDPSLFPPDLISRLGSLRGCFSLFSICFK